MHFWVLAQLRMLKHSKTGRDEVLLLLPDLPLDDVHSLFVRELFVVLEDTNDVRIVRVRHPLFGIGKEVVDEPNVIC